MIKKDINNYVKATIYVFLSSLIYSVGIKCFIQAEGVNLLSSGIGGVSVILSRVLENKYDKTLVFSLAQIILNIPVFILAYKRIGKRYTFFTILNLALTSILVLLIPASLFNFLNIDPRSDLLLVAVCAGVLSGVSSGIALKEGLSTGGVDTIVTYLGIRYNKQAGSLSIICNAIILLVGGLLFNEWVAMLYTVIEIFVAGEMINMIYRRTKKILICIVTEKPKEMCQAFLEFSKHGMTIFNCKGAYSNADKFEVKTVVLESEVKKIIETANRIDDKAFITIVNVHNVNGAFTMPDIQ